MIKHLIVLCGCVLLASSARHPTFKYVEAKPTSDSYNIDPLSSDDVDLDGSESAQFGYGGHGGRNGFSSLGSLGSLGKGFGSSFGRGGFGSLGRGLGSSRGFGSFGSLSGLGFGGGLGGLGGLGSLSGLGGGLGGLGGRHGLGRLF